MERITLKLKQVLWFADDTNLLIIFNYGDEDSEKCVLNGVDNILTEEDIIKCFLEWGDANVSCITALVNEDGLPFLRIDIEQKGEKMNETFLEDLIAVFGAENIHLEEEYDDGEIIMTIDIVD